MRKVISNLISNAQKYSAVESTIWIMIEKLEKTVQLSVRDEGIGIPQEDQKRLFEAFHRAENVGIIRGTGLGLVIAKQAIKQHSGSIEFISREAIGSTFTIHLPLIDMRNNESLKNKT
jgi:signal transduction histidine kinase